MEGVKDLTAGKDWRETLRFLPFVPHVRGLKLDLFEKKPT